MYRHLSIVVKLKRPKMIEFLKIKSIVPEVDEYPLMSSPAPILVMTAIYLFVVLKLGPAYMEKRKPYDLRKFLIFYNLFQICACYWAAAKFTELGFSFRNTWQCIPSKLEVNENWRGKMKVGMFLLFVRGIEVVETLCFVLRKKQNQVTFLHIYHHISVFWLLWLTIKISAGDMELFVMVLNLYVHVVMYIYYFLALFKPMQMILRPIKPAITIMQMTQFVLMFGHVVTALKPSCHVNKTLFYSFLPNVVIIFYLFYDFYKKAYNNKKAAQLEKCVQMKTLINCNNNNNINNVKLEGKTQ
uniref:Elongation of very long chain fatty acids protein n=1 Tax=Culicoides sonorensis TaxID=179676 RepID=A0A336LKC7_CULSO